MAFYPGDETVTINGIQVPRTVVENAFPQLVGTSMGPRGQDTGAGPQPQPLPPPEPLAPIIPAQRGRGGATRSKIAQAGIVPVTDEVAPGPVQPFATTEVAAPVVAVEPEPAQPVPPPVAEPAAPATEQSLRDTGAAGVLEKQNEAVDLQAQAARDLADRQAAEQSQIADAYIKRNDEIDKQLADRAKAAEETQRAIDARMTEYDAAVKRYGDTKVDRSVDHPIVAAISAVLSMIGSAHKKEQGNLALDVLMKQIDRKVNLQLAEREKQKDIASMKRSDIDMLRQRASDRTAQYNLAIAGEIEKATRQVEAIGARSNSEQVKARAAQTVAELQEKKATYLGNAVGAQMSKDERDRAFEEQKRKAAVDEKQNQQQIAQGWKRISQADRHFDEEMKFKRDQLDADKQAALLKARAAGDEASLKQLIEMEKLDAELGVGDGDGNPLMQPEGVKMLDQAKEMESKAQQFAQAAQGEQDPAKRQQLEQAAQMHAQNASALRGEANLRHRWRTKDAKEISDTLASTQTAISTIDDIKRLEKIHGKSWIGTSEGEQLMRTKGTQLMLVLKEAYKTGTLDKGSVEVLNEISGGDPTKVNWNTFTSFLGNAKNTTAALEGVADGLTKRATNLARRKQFRGELKFNRADFKEAAKTETEKAAESLLKGKTSVEREEATKPGGGRKFLQDAESLVFGTTQDYKKQAGREAESGSLKYVGFSPEQEKPLEAVIAAAKTGDQFAIDTLKKMRTDRSRPALMAATSTLLRDRFPEYEREWSGQLSNVLDEHMPVERLRDAGIAGDKAAVQELIRRQAAGDKSAQKAIEVIINSKGRN